MTQIKRTPNASEVNSLRWENDATLIPRTPEQHDAAMEQVFAFYYARGRKPEDLFDAEQRAPYAAWLKKNKSKPEAAPGK